MSLSIVTMLGRKGGCGKTTTLLAWAGCLAKQNKRILVVDLDCQASATRTLFGVEKVFDPDDTVLSLFYEPEAGHDRIVHPTPVDNIHCIPATEALDQLMYPYRDHNREVLHPALQAICHNYDFILIDTPPNITCWPAFAALAVSDWVISPIVPEPYGAHSTSDTVNVINHYNEAALLGFVLVMVERNSINSEYTKAIRKHLKSDVFKTEIPKTVAFRDAASRRLPITHLSPKPAAVKAVEALAAEMDNRIKNKVRQQRKAA